ncbi:unnamed protein product [Protopolystoma xenopodis]|uniref:Uncharacterized protein n=1 Tax=Protopolystoma xenopodis TaxID=117903 RepID=A0A3S5B181_9PLAT|nr:unnamed protein product [Protopolystoma xenopodis]
MPNRKCCHATGATRSGLPHRSAQLQESAKTGIWVPVQVVQALRGISGGHNCFSSVCGIGGFSIPD